jgi:outer membrane protein OmpA-like peptidoglycan-associated protein
MSRGAVVFVPIILVLFLALPVPTAAQEGTKEEEEVISIDPSQTGETGIISTLVADSLPKGKFSIGLFYHNFDRELTDLDVNQYAISLAYGLMDRLELAVSVIGTWQVDFDQRPSILSYPPRVLASFPFPISTIEEGFGDIYIGAKYTFVEDSERTPGFAVRGFVKIPTGNEEEGFGSGATDFGADLILSKHVSKSFLLTGNLGFSFLGTPEIYADNNLSFGNEMRWGVGGKLFVTKVIRLLMEMTGGFSTGDDDFPQDNNVDARFGLEFKVNNGFRFGFGYTRALVFGEPAMRGDGAFAMITYSPGWKKEKKIVEPEKEVIPEVKKETQAPVAKLTAEPTEGYAALTVKFDASESRDPDGGSIQEYFYDFGDGQESDWVSVATPRHDYETAGTYSAKVKVKDDEGETSDWSPPVTITVTEFGFEEIYFDFDSSNLRPESVEKLNKVVKYLKAKPEIKVTVEGNCCYIGLEEYNLALGDARARAIKDYLLRNGIDEGRIATHSWGEAKPKYDNTQEETRQYNRRGDFVIKKN